MRVGLIGRQLGHSFSPQIHAMLADYGYRLVELEPCEVGTFLQSEEFDALNVTIPYKKSVLPFLSELSPEAEALGAVNTVTRTARGLCGDNTDYYGFLYMLKRSGIEVEGKKVLVLGSGGAGVTARAVLSDGGACVRVISRGGDDNYGNLERHYDADVIVNATPVGMFPDVGKAPVRLADFTRCSGVIDLIYNPARTRLLLEAEQLGIPYTNGLPMLVSQAKKSCEIFTGETIDDAVIERITARVAFDSSNIVLVGMPGCGKSTAGAALAKRLSRRFVDTDAVVEKACGMPVQEIIRTMGEEEFRLNEHKAVCQAGKQSSLVIATGGGVVTRRENYCPLHQNSIIVFLNREPDGLSTQGRPLSQANGVNRLYEERLPKYLDFCDCSVQCAADTDETVGNIISAIEKDMII